MTRAELATLVSAIFRSILLAIYSPVSSRVSHCARFHQVLNHFFWATACVSGQTLACTRMILSTRKKWQWDWVIRFRRCKLICIREQHAL